jgi:polysaccharide biosynthesis transport protein
MKPDPKNAMLFDVADGLVRSWWTVVAGVSLGLAGGTLALNHLPTVYEATTRILVIPPSIPKEFVGTTVVDYDLGARLAALQEEVLSRGYLIEVVDGGLGITDAVQAEHMLQRIRENVQVTSSKSFFTIRVRDESPDRAARVANALADQYIRKNTEYRTGRAEDATRTLQQLADKVREELSAREAEIARFKAANLYQLGANLQTNLQLLSARQRDVEVNEQALAQARERMRTLMIQKEQARAEGRRLAAAPPSPSPPDPYTVRLNELNGQLGALRLRYFEDHPDVQAKIREIENFKAHNQPSPPAMVETHAGATGAQDDPAVAAVEQQIMEAARAIDRLEASQASIRDEIAALRRRIDASPQVDQQLAEMMKGYDVLEARYKDYQAKAGRAEGAQVLEETERGERFEVLERARPPALPVEPNPSRVHLISLLFGMTLFVGPVVGRRLLRPLISSEAVLRSATDVPVLVSIPLIPTGRAIRNRWARRIKNLALAAASLAASAIVYATHYF